jgi:gliding motility-associated-like protein
VVWNTGQTTASIWVSTSGTYEATASNSGCSATGSLAVVVSPAPTVVVDITSGADVFCTGDSVQLTANATGATSYLWSNGATTQTIWVTSGDDYCVTAMNDAFCSASACRTVTEVTTPTVDLGPDMHICQDSVTTLAVQNPIPGATYTWTVDGTTVGTGTSISVSPAVGITEYIVTVDVNCGTTATDAIKVHVSQAVVASFTRDPAGIVILGNNVQFTNTSTGNPNTFLWNFGDGGTDVVNNPAHMYMAQGVYDVTLIASNGLCSDTANGSVEVQVIIDVPNPFTPNNDGYNDMVWISGADNENLYMQVFSRWGHMVWEGQGRTLEWDGKSNSGVDLEEGTYYYVINITPEGGATKTQTGFITLLR